jgi:hypothetical protein
MPDLKVISLVDRLEMPMPTAPEDIAPASLPCFSNAPAIFFLVEDNQECVERACKLLRTCRGPTPLLVILLVRLEEDAADLGVVEEYISDVMESGAHDAIVRPINHMELLSMVRASLARAAVRKVQNDMYVKRFNKSKRQCNDFFWKYSHAFVEGCPEVEEELCEVEGKSIENNVFTRLLGHGAFGRVYEFRDMYEDDISGAVKVISKTNVAGLDQLCAIVDEHHMLKRLTGHPNVVEAHAFVHAKLNLYIFMGMPGTANLARLLKVQKQKRGQGRDGLPEDQAMKVFRCVADGLAHCHRNKVAHCDIKPENVVVTATGSAALVDFGECVDLAEDIAPLKFPIGTMPYTPPEILLLRDPWDPVAADAWALGVLLFTLVRGRHAFCRIMAWTRQTLAPRPERGEELLAFFAGFGTSAESPALRAMKSLWCDALSPGIHELVVGMLQPIPADRWLVAEVSVRCVGFASPAASDAE